MNYDIGPYDPCPCGSGAKYKFCCAAKAKQHRHGKFPIGTVAHYGPDDETTTKIAAGVVLSEWADAIVERWVGTNVVNDPKVVGEIKCFFARHGVKSVTVSQGNLGCPHEEGEDFATGQDCPFCPFWAGKQGTARRDELDDFLPDDDEDDTDGKLLDQQVEIIEKLEDKRDWDAAFARVDAILRDSEMDFGKAVEVLFNHLKANLSLPCEVTGSEDFQWEEGYVFGFGSQSEYRRLKETQPSYEDRFQLLDIIHPGRSQWMTMPDDIAARVRRITDGKEFVLGLTDLEATDKASSNYQHIDDYVVWFVNSR